MITQARLKELLYYDYETGIFIWLVSKAIRIKIGSIAGALRKDGYLNIEIDYKGYLAHRLAWLYMTGEWPENQIDHINMIKSDNRFCNLREATRNENRHNQTKFSNNTSGIKGVDWHKPNHKWRARIRLNNKLIYLGSYNDIKDAAAAYEIASKQYHGKFSRTK